MQPGIPVCLHPPWPESVAGEMSGFMTIAHPVSCPHPQEGGVKDILLPRESMAGGRPLLSAGLCNKGGSLKIDFELCCRKGSETYRAGVYLSYTPCI